MTSMPTDRAQATTYTVNLDCDAHEWITVVLTCLAGQGPHKPEIDTWAVRDGPWCLNDNNEWELEPQPSSREADFMARCRFTFDEALERGMYAATIPFAKRPRA